MLGGINEQMIDKARQKSDPKYNTRNKRARTLASLALNFIQ
jgi:hypothetical protein